MDEADPGGDVTWITTAEAAQRLGVKPETVYAYVSRGLLVSRRAPSGRGSLLDRAQVDGLASEGRRGRAVRTRVHRFRSVASAVSHSSADGLYYRDVDACLWAADVTLEQAAAYVLGAPGKVADPGLGPITPDVARVPLERRPAAVVTRAAETGWGAGTDPAATPGLTLGLLPALIEALGPLPSDPARQTESRGWAWQVVARLTGRPPSAGEVRAVELLLVLLLDHGLTASTTATRAAASARAGLADCLLAGYAALAGHLHGMAPPAVHALLADALAGARDDADAAPSRPPGFGHPLYPDGDPRAQVVLAAWKTVPSAGPALEAVAAIRSRLPSSPEHDPTIDTALAVTCLALDVAASAGPALFALARTVGLAAHAAEEWGEEGLRWRGRAATRAMSPGG